jgi:hypothetical protein
MRHATDLRRLQQLGWDTEARERLQVGGPETMAARHTGRSTAPALGCEAFDVGQR